jgi:hypothetical protein
MQIHTEFRVIPGNFTAKNTAEFRKIPRNSVCFSKNSVFRRKSKSTSVDTLPPPPQEARPATYSKTEKERQQERQRKGGGELIHTMACKPGPLKIIQYSLVRRCDLWSSNAQYRQREKAIRTRNFQY